MTVEPCCCDSQLPPILEGPAHLGGTSFFTTNGDVTAKRLIESVAYLVPNAHLLLVTKHEDVFLARFLRSWIDKNFLADVGWIAPFAATNSESKKELKSLPEACCARYDVDGECMVLWNERGDALVLSGPLPESTPDSPHLCFYSTWVVRNLFTDAARRRLRQAVETLLPILRLHGSNRRFTILKAALP